MNERLTLQDLIDLLVKKQDIPKKEAEIFLRELVSILSESIEQNETVKIKDFGTFKLVKVNARKSVDVNTGDDIEIAAHYKLSFVPDKVIKDAVNRPFAHFETVLLEEGVTFDNTLKTQVLTEGEESDEAEDADEVEDATEVVSAIQLADVGNEQQLKDEPIEEHQVVESQIIEQNVVEIQTVDTQAIVEDVVEPIVEEVVNIPPQVFNEAVLPVRQEEVVDEPIANLEPLVVAHPQVTALPSNQVVAKPEQEPVSESEPEPDLTLEPAPKYIKRRTAYDEDDDFDDESVDYSEPKRNYYVIGLIAVALIAVALVVYRYFPYLKSVLEPDGVYYDPNGGYNAGEALPDDTLQLNDATPPLKKEEEPKTDIPAKTEDKKVEDKKAETKPTKKEYLADVTIGSGTTLRQIAMDSYGNKSFWVYIYEENKTKIPNPNNIPAGTKLKVPSLKNFGIDPKNAKDIEKAKAKERKLFAEFS